MAYGMSPKDWLRFQNPYGLYGPTVVAPAPDAHPAVVYHHVPHPLTGRELSRVGVPYGVYDAQPQQDTPVNFNQYNPLYQMDWNSAVAGLPAAKAPAWNTHAPVGFGSAPVGGAYSRLFPGEFPAPPSTLMSPAQYPVQGPPAPDPRVQGPPTPSPLDYGPPVLPPLPAHTRSVAPPQTPTVQAAPPQQVQSDAVPAPAPAPAMAVAPHEAAQYQMRDAYNAGSDSGGLVGGIMSALGAMRQYQPEQAPHPITVSGSSVIGLTPEQTTHLLDRVSRENELNTQMHQHRIDTMNADMRAQRGEVLRAAEAEANRRHADTLEEKRLQNQIYMEGLRAGKPNVQPVAEHPGWFSSTQIGADGVPKTSLFQAQNADTLPPTDKGGTWVDTYGPDGTVIKKHIGVNDTAQVAPAPVQTQLSEDQKLRLIAEREKDFQGLDQEGPDGKRQPITPEMANSLANIWVENNSQLDTSRLSFNGQPVKLVQRDKTKPSRLVEQTMPDGSKVWAVPQEGQVAKPAPTPTADDVMKKEYGTTWAKYLETNKDNPEALQRAVQTLANHGISENDARAILPDQMKDTWGSYIGWGDQTKRWTWPSAVGAPGAPSGSTGPSRGQIQSMKTGDTFEFNGKKFQKLQDGGVKAL